MGGFTCTICTLPDEVLVQINSKLRKGIPQKRVAEEYGVSKDAIGRHYRGEHHKITKPAKKRAVKKPKQKVALQDESLPVKYTGPDGVLKSIYHVMNELETMFDDSRGGETNRTTIEIAKVIKGFHELSAKIEGLIREGQVNILVSPGWVALQNDIIAALREYPEARAAVLERLRSHNTHDVEEAEFEVTS